MPIINIMCPICTEIYNNSDIVYSTSCGHVFHETCLKGWIRRQDHCPQCRHDRPGIYKLHLNFEECEENPEEVEDIQLKLKSSDEKIIQLQEQLEEAEAEYLRLQEQCSAAEESKTELENKFSEINDLETDFMHLQSQYTDSAEYVKVLEERINQLLIEGECKVAELSETIAENDTLKASLDEKQNVLSDDILTERLKILEQKLKHITAEFDKEIKTSTQLSIEKMELQSRIRILKSNQQHKEVLKEHSEINTNMPRRHSVKKVNTPNKALQENSKSCDETFNVIVVTQIPLNEVTLPLENVIVKLAAAMKFAISSDDLIQVRLLNSTNKQAKKAQFMVQFRSTIIKDQFLSKRHNLKHNSVYKFVGMDDIHELFTYAQKKLLDIGFSSVSCQNCKITAIDAAGVVSHVQSKTEVDNLASKQSKVPRLNL